MNSKNTTRLNNKKVFIKGMHDGVPIALGYLAVSFSLGIAAKNAGMTPFQGFLASALCNASAGEYAGFVTIAALASFAEIAIITLIANARYMLMSCAMSQRISPDTSIIHRILMGFYLTDELFAIAIARPGYLNPYYTYGAVSIAGPCWAVGTALGAMAGNLLPGKRIFIWNVFGNYYSTIKKKQNHCRHCCRKLCCKLRRCLYSTDFFPF